MGTKISGKEYQISDIFSSMFDFHIPSYQRPYAWGKEETSTLFDDLYGFYKSERNDENYFLGSAVLIKEEEKSRADVVDGQQRLTTLTILLSVLTHHFTEDDVISDYKKYLCEPGRRSLGLPAAPRLHLREKDQAFFEKYIQGSKLQELLSLDKASLPTESQKHILENAETFENKISEKNMTEQELLDFGSFILKRCYLVVVSTPTQKSAYRVFSVMNNRGLDLLPIDIIKADVIGKIDEKDQDNYTQTWEDLEIQATRNGFNDVISHMRMIFVKAKAKKTLLEEFNELVLPKFTPTDLIDNYLTPYTEAYSILKKKDYVATKNAEQINNYLYWLNKIDNSDWMPTAIKFFANKKDDSDYTLWFVKKLERLAAYLQITSKDVNHRIERYAKILNEMEINPEHSNEAKLSSIELTADEKEDFMKVLSGDVYKEAPKRRNYIILRLDSFVASVGASYDPAILTIEHVLPQTVDPDTEWPSIWPDEKIREKWVHKIGNLIPLPRKQNSAAQNFDFDKKKDKYFKTKNGVTPYALATQVLNEPSWTLNTVETRQKALIGFFEKNWELK
jgi:hypothetical protein